MNRYSVALLALVAAVALAGCGGLGGDSGTPTPNATATDGPYDLPLNGSAVTDGHREAIDGAGSFQYQRNTTVRAVPSGAFIRYSNVTAAVNRRTGSYRATENSTFREAIDIYVGANGTALLRQRLDNRTAYDRQSRTEGASNPYAYPPIGRYLDGLNYSYAGTESAGSRTVHVYEASGLDALDPDEHGLTALDPHNLTAVSAALRVTDAGRIESFRYSVVGTNQLGNSVRFTVSLGYSGVGSTTVSEPAWVAEAEQVTG